MIERLKAIASERRRFGYRRLGLMLRREGIVANHKRVYRIYRDLALQFGRAASVGFATFAAMTCPSSPIRTSVGRSTSFTIV